MSEEQLFRDFMRKRSNGRPMSREQELEAIKWRETVGIRKMVGYLKAYKEDKSAHLQYFRTVLREHFDVRGLG